MQESRTPLGARGSWNRTKAAVSDVNHQIPNFQSHGDLEEDVWYGGDRTRVVAGKCNLFASCILGRPSHMRCSLQSGSVGAVGDDGT